MLLVALSTFHPPPSSSFASILPRLQIRPTQLASLLVQIFILLVIHSSHQLELWPSNTQDHPIRTSPSSETGSTPMSSLRSGLAIQPGEGPHCYSEMRGRLSEGQDGLAGIPDLQQLGHFPVPGILFPILPTLSLFFLPRPSHEQWCP